MEEKYIVTTEGLTKMYGRKAAAKDINIKIREGEIYGLIGRNGAGKTTIMRMLSGLSRPTKGTFSLFGMDIHELRRKNKPVGVLIEAPGIYPKMNAYDNMKIKVIAMGIKGDQDKYIKGLLELVGLADTGKKKAGSFSLGMRQRLGIALALVGDPKLIILDEPINGLDPQGIVEVRKLLATMRDEMKITVMISSHILEELGKLADSYGIIHNGKLIDEFTTEDLHERSGNYTFVNTDDNKKALEVIRKMGLEKCELDNDNMLRIKDTLSLEKNVCKALVENNIFVKEIRSQTFSLEDYYLKITSEGIPEDNTAWQYSQEVAQV